MNDLTNNLDGIIREPQRTWCLKEDYFMEITRSLDACEIAFMVSDLEEALTMARAMQADTKRLIDDLEEMAIE